MKYAFLLLLTLTFFSCNKEQVDVLEPGNTDTFIIGYTGGWGGGPAYKLEDGQLYRSVADRFLGDPDQIAGATSYEPLNDEAKLRLVSDLLAEFPGDAFSEVPNKFDCPDQAYDGTCPYLIQLDGKDASRFWTLSEEDTEAEAEFAAYMGRVNEVLGELWE